MVMTAYHSDSSSNRRHICHRSNSCSAHSHGAMGKGCIAIFGSMWNLEARTQHDFII
jgi:hypothetical protein